MVSVSIYLNTGDVLRPHTEGGSFSDVARSAMNVIIEADSEYVVTPAQSNLTNWEDYTPTTQGLGTVSSVNVSYRRVGDSIEIQGTLTTGTVTAVECQIGLPSGLTLDSVKIPTTKVVGMLSRNATSGNDFSMLATGGDSFFNVGVMGAATAFGVTPQNADIVSGNTQVISFFASAPITGWDSNINFLAAIPNATQSSHYDGIAGYGSSSTAIPYYTNARGNTGSGLYTITNTSTLGFVITALTRCQVTFDMSAYHTAQIHIGITKNGTELTTEIQSVSNVSERRAIVGQAEQAIFCSTTVILEAGDTLRPQTNKVNPASSKDRWIANVFAKQL